MECYTPQANRRHNPVDSICRKLQSIQWRGDREPNSPFQIPKFSSSSYDSPQCGLRNNLEAILKRGALNRDEGEMGRERGNEKKGKGMAMPRSSASQSSLSPSIPLPTLSTPTCNYSTPANVTYTITSTFGERRGADGSDLRQVKTWQRNCSTPAGGSKDSPLFTFTQGPQSVQPESERPSRSLPLSQTFTPSHTTLFYNFNFQSVDTTNSTECELPSPALVVKRLAVGDGGTSMAFENKQNMAEISLICEENLLDTIFHACDTQRRGKVYVSHIVDYLRHTTSRSSEDSGLEELCNMLDPERKDVSIDLDTYHAVMREWIDDCRNNGKETEDDVTHDSVKLRDSLSAKRSMQLNMTSGSLEAFGGEVSRAEFETSELVYCVADLQMSNQKLQEEVKKFKQVVEAMEDSNQKLAEENEQLRNQARVNQQLAQKEKMLKEEVEEMKATLSCTEEGRAYASAHSKHVVSQDQAAHRGSIKTHSHRSHLSKISGTFRKIVQLKLSEHSVSIVSIDLYYCYNNLFASPGVDRLSTTMSFATLLDETLDREVLLMLQGPSPERMALEFRCLLNKLTVQDKLETRRAEWALILDQLAQYTDSLEKELIKIASNMRRSRTEILHLSVKVQEQENQNRQLCEELDQLKTPQHSREASCQTPAPEEEPGDDLDWDEELAVQDFLKDKLAEKICWVQDRQTESKPEETANRLIDTGEEDDGEENWTVADTAGEGQVRDTSTPLSPLFGQAEPGQERTVEEGHGEWGHPEGHNNPQSKSIPQSSIFKSLLLLFLCFQAEFQRLALGFKCDMFTLEKRLRLEERSRDLAEENIRREVSSCQGLLQALIPLCEDDNQSMEIIQRLQKNLDILIQSMTRVSSRSEMLGAIHQENRIGKAVEVMIQHVENLKRMYTKEHAELLELRETLMQNERSFGSQTERGWRCCRQRQIVFVQSSVRRVSIAAIPRSGGSSMHFEMVRMTPTSVAGKSMARPPLKRFISSAAWVDTDEPSLMMKGPWNGPIWVPQPDLLSGGCHSSGSGRGLWLWVAMVVVLAGLLALLASLVMQPAVDAAHVGTGDSWMTIQQLLWPYTGLRHHGQPPV
uniref:Lymphoid-restricted membrane protein n=1 Tax=Monopterus albus TaxID=43700 RepID=A0A3Q3Q2W9_MONAL